MKINSYAKINYTLEVGSKRSDGFHSLKSIVQTISLKDIITINKSHNYQLICSDPIIPTNDTNTVTKLWKTFKDLFKICGNVEIFIEKNIPSQGGLGGGSSNASYVLLGLNEIFQTNLTKKEMCEISAKIGSDCPLFIYGGSLLMEGRGEIITQIQPLPKVYLVIIKPDFSVSTKEAYAKLDKRENFNFSGKSDLLINSSINVNKLVENLTNDFELLFDLKDIKENFKKSGALNSLLSGSGSCVYGIYKTQEKQELGFKYLKNIYNNYKIFKCESIN